MLPATIYKKKLKMDQRSKCKTRNYKTLKKKIGRTFNDINHSNIIYDPLEVMEIKTKINK